MSDRAVASIPEFPTLVATVRRKQDRYVVVSRRLGVQLELLGSPEELDDIDAALALCDGTFEAREVLTDRATDTVRALTTLSAAALLVDGRAHARTLLRELMRSPHVTTDVLRGVTSEPRWRDPAAKHLAHEPRSNNIPQPLRRSRSLPLEGATFQPVTAETLSTLLAWSYGSEGEWKPVASAGRLWPLSLYAITPSGSGMHVSWFDDDAQALALVRSIPSRRHVTSLFVRPAFFESVFSGGGAIIVICADLRRIAKKYGNRATLFVALETGAVNQQLALSAQALGLGVRAFGGWPLPRLRALLTEELEPILVVAVGSLCESS